MKVLTITALFALVSSQYVGAFQTVPRTQGVAAVHSKSLARTPKHLPRVLEDKTRLHASAKVENPYEVDTDAITKYLAAGVVQMGGFALVLMALDKAVEATGFAPPTWLCFLFFYGCSLKSRVLNPLSNKRPNAANPMQSDLQRPSWFPPGVIFPIMWILIIGPIRAYSSTLVYQGAGEFFNIATLSFLLHLSVGDIWNTVNNVEKRLGASASGVFLVIGSAANAAFQYYQVDNFAGKLLGLTLLWLCTAGALVNSIWRLDPDAATGQKDALFPAKGDVETEFAWFQSGD